MYDISKNEMRAIRERAKMRDALKAEWQKKVTDPHRGAHDGGHIVSVMLSLSLSLSLSELSLSLSLSVKLSPPPPPLSLSLLSLCMRIMIILHSYHLNQSYWLQPGWR